MAAQPATDTLHDYLRDARGTHTRLAVTRAGGPDSTNLSRFERGQRLPSVQTLKWLCDFYEVSFDEGLRLLQDARIERDLAAVAG